MGISENAKGLNEVEIVEEAEDNKVEVLCHGRMPQKTTGGSDDPTFKPTFNLKTYKIPKIGKKRPGRGP